MQASLLALISEMCHGFQDTFNGSASNEPFFTSVATVTVHVRDIDNRPPWFQPCLRTNLGLAKLCVSTGYRGRVNLTEKEVTTVQIFCQFCHQFYTVSQYDESADQI